MGKVFSRGELWEVGRICVENGLLIISDEVYERLCFQPFPRLAALGDESIAESTVTIGSVGKSFNATGWRVGFVIGDSRTIGPIQWASTLLSFVASGPAQHAATVGYQTAYKHDFWARNAEDLKLKVARFCEVMRELKLPVCAFRLIRTHLTIEV